MNSTQIGLGFLGAAIIISGLVGMSCVSSRNEFARQEEGILAEYKNNQNKLSGHFQKIQEMVQVPEMYTDDLKKVFDSAIQGRYKDKNPVLLFVQEHNPNFDSKLYTNLQVEISAGRDDFKTGQTSLLSRCQSYDTLRRTFPASMWATGYPSPNHDWNKICTPITDVLTDKVYESGHSEPLKLRSKEGEK